MKITDNSHLDHGMTPAQIAHIAALFAGRAAFFIETFELPPELGTVRCDLHGPVVGDAPVPPNECRERVRGERVYPSRVCRRYPRQTRTVTVIAGPHLLDPCILYTAFGGPLAPREPGDPTLPPEQHEESANFWAEHALSEEQPWPT